MKKVFIILVCLCLMMTSVSVAETEPDHVLHIGIDQLGSEENLIPEKLFLEKNPDWKIVYHQLDADQLSAQMISGISNLDLLIVSHSSMMNLAKQGALMDLDEELKLDSWPETLQSMREPLTVNGRLYALPHSVQYFQWVWNDEIASILNCDAPETPYTWNEFFSVMKNLNYDLDNDGARDLGLIPGSTRKGMDGAFLTDMIETYIDSYAEELGGFRTSLFHEITDAFVSCWNDEAIMPYDQVPIYGDDDGTLIYSFATIDDIFVIDHEYRGKKSAYLLPPVIDSEDPRYPGFYQVWCMPRNAASKGKAREFLQETISAEGLSLFTDAQKWFARSLPDILIYDPDAISMFARFTPDKSGELIWTVTAEKARKYETEPMSEYYISVHEDTIQRVQCFHENLCPIRAGTIELWNAFFDSIDGYRKGNLSFDDLANRMDLIWDMMINE